MDGLKTALYKKVEAIYNQKMKDICNEKEGWFGAMGMAYINFAKREPNFFKLLFMTDTFGEKSLMEIVGSTEGDDKVIEGLSAQTGLSAERSKELYAGAWIATHGIASLYATNNCSFSEDEIKRMLENAFFGLVMKLRKEETKQ